MGAAPLALAPPARDRLFTRRQFLVYEHVVLRGGKARVAERALGTKAWAVEHPGVNLDEHVTWQQWHLERATGDAPVLKLRRK
jgi:hypothetical protein